MNRVTPDFADFLMKEALVEAELGARKGEVPVGAVLAIDGVVVSRAHNLTETDRFVGAHAELLAIQRAGVSGSSWRLDSAVLCVTLEPCTMCFGAIRLARIPTVIFGAGDSKQGAMGSLYDLSLDPRLGAPMKVIRNLKANECGELLKKFFEARRG